MSAIRKEDIVRHSTVKELDYIRKTEQLLGTGRLQEFISFFAVDFFLSFIYYIFAFYAGLVLVFTICFDFQYGDRSYLRDAVRLCKLAFCGYLYFVTVLIEPSYWNLCFFLAMINFLSNFVLLVDTLVLGRNLAGAYDRIYIVWCVFSAFFAWCGIVSVEHVVSGFVFYGMAKLAYNAYFMFTVGRMVHDVNVPAPPLVGIEPNPGPESRLEKFMSEHPDFPKPECFPTMKEYRIAAKEQQIIDRKNKKKTKKIMEKKQKKEDKANAYFGKKVKEEFKYLSTDFPTLGGFQGTVVHLESELSAKSQSDSRARMQSRVERATYGSGVFSTSIERCTTARDVLFGYYRSVKNGDLYPAYELGGTGFVLFRHGAIRYVLNQIAMFGCEEEAVAFLDEFAFYSDYDFAMKIGEYITLYTPVLPEDEDSELEAQAFFVPEEFTHRIDNDQFQRLMFAIHSISNNFSPDNLGKLGGSMAEEAMAKLDVKAMLPDGVYDKIKSILETICGVDVKAIVFVVFLSLFAWTCATEGLTLAVCKRYAILALCLFGICESRVIGQKLSSFLFAFEKSELEAQSLDEGVFCDMLCGLMGIFFLKDSEMSVRGFAKSIKGFSQVSKDLSAFVHYSFKVIQAFFDYVCVEFLGLKSFKFFTEEIPGLEKWTLEVSTVMRESMEGKLLKNMRNAERLIQLEKEGIEFLGTSRDVGTMLAIREKVRPVLNAVTALRKQFEQSGIYNRSTRQQPVFVMFKGNSQIGKTKMIRPFVARLLSRVCPMERDRLLSDFESFVYSLNPAAEFWEGYQTQAVLMMDEYSVVKDGLATASNIQTEVIKCKNTFAYMLNMAALESKGNTFFKGKLMVATSNIKDTYEDASKYVQCPEAVTNRIDFDCIVAVKKEFATEETKDEPPEDRLLDKSKIPATDTGFYWHLHEFYIEKYSMIKNQKKVQKTGPLTVDQLLDACAKKYYEYEEEATHDVPTLREAIERGKKDLEAQAYDDFDHQFFMNLLDEAPMKDLITALGRNAWRFSTVGSLQSLDSFSLFFVDEEIPKFFEMLDFGVKQSVLAFMEVVPDFADWVACTDSAKFAHVVAKISEKVAVQGPVERVDCVVTMTDVAARMTINACNMLRRSILGVSAKYLGYFNPIARVDAWLQYFHSFLAAAGVVVFITTMVWKALSYLLGSIKGYLFPDRELVQGTKVEQVAATKSNPLGLPVEFQNKISSAHKMHVGPVLPQIGEGIDNEAQKIAVSIANKNWFTITFGGAKRGSGFFLKKKLFVCVGHFSVMIAARTKTGDKIILESIGGKDRYEVTREEFMKNMSEVAERDVLMTNLESIPCEFPDISRKFATSNDLVYRKKGNAVFLRETEGRPFLVSTKIESCDSMSYSGSWSSQKINLAKGYRYNVATQQGECGSLIFIDDVGLPTRKIVGLHVAGDGSRFGVCSVVTQEVLEALQSVLKAQGLWDNEFKTMKIVEENVSPLPGTNSRSSIIRSPLHGAWGASVKKQARLNNFVNEDGETVDVLWNALKGYDEPVGNLEDNVIDVVMASVFRDMAARSLNELDFEVLPLEVAIKGKVGTLFEPLPRDTSPGYPWNAKPRVGYTGKTRFLGIDHTVDAAPDKTDHGYPSLGFQYNVDAVDWNLLKNEILEAMAQMERGERIRVIYTGSKKDELRSIEKVKKGDTRYFSGKPLFYLILCRMFFGSFEAWIKMNKIISGSCIGINPYSGDWDVLARGLLEKEHQYAGDFKKFDRRQMRNVLWAVGVYIRKMYNDKYDHIRAALWYELVSSRHLVGDKIVEFDHSLPSGHWLTTPTNTIYVQFAYRFCWLAAHNWNVVSLVDFTTHNAVYAYGDDSVCAITEYGAQVYDKHGLVELMSQMGLDFTAENKEEIFQHRSKLSSKTFLKRGFRYEPLLGRYVAPLSMETIREMPYWTKRKETERIFKTNVEVALQELAFHEEDVYREWYNKISRGIMSRGLVAPVSYPRWIVIDMAVGGLNSALSKKMRLNLNTMKVTEHESSLTVRASPVHVELIPGLNEPEIVEKIYHLEPQGADPDGGEGLIEGSQSRVEMTGTDETVGASFENDGDVVARKVTMTDIQRTLVESGDDGISQQDIRAFLGKPQLLANFVWSNQTANSNLAVVNLPQDMIALPVFNNKIRGFLNFRADVELRMTVNATPFQQGRLMCVFSPLGNVFGAYPGVRSRSLLARSQLPRVELDVSCDTEAVMTIPYVGPFTHYNTLTQEGPMGRFYLVIYHPLTTGTGGPANVTVNVWCRFVNVHLSGLTPTVAQGADPKHKEKELMSKGTISGALDAGTKIFKGLGKIPMLSAIAQPVAWATALSSGVVSAFGYSKPMAETAPMRIIQQQNAYGPNCDGVDTSRQLALFASNQVQILPGFAGNDEDEAAILAVAQRYAYLATVTWLASATSGTALYSPWVDPQALLNVVNDGSIIYHDCVPLNYISKMFRLWRGSVRLKMKFVKTPYHSGRLEICFGWGYAPGYDTGYMLREIVDIRETNEIEFVLPYSYHQPYYRTSANATGSRPWLLVRVQTPLRAPPSCDQNIAILFEFAGGPDTEFAFPQIGVEAIPRPYNSPSMISAQGADNACALTVAKPFGGSKIGVDNVDFASTCIGEKVTTLLQLVKCFSAVGTIESNAGRLMVERFGVGNTSTVGNTIDYYTAIAPMFALSRGGYRIKAVYYNEGVPTTVSSGSFANLGLSSTGNVIEAFPMDLATPHSRTFDSANGSRFLEIAVPQYLSGFSRLNAWTDIRSTPYVSGITAGFAFVSNTLGTNRMMILRAVADDFSFGSFLGTPPVWIERII